MKIELTIEELESIVSALSTALTCLNDPAFLESHYTDATHEVRDSFAFVDSKAKEHKK